MKATITAINQLSNLAHTILKLILGTYFGTHVIATKKAQKNLSI